MKYRHLYIVAATLTFLALAIFWYKAAFLQFPLMPLLHTNVWDIEVHLRFAAKNQPVKVSMFLPRNTRRYTILDENFLSQGFGLTTVQDDQNRRAVWSRRKSKGLRDLYYRVTVRPIDVPEPPMDQPVPSVQAPTFSGASLQAAESLLADITEKSADITTLVAELTARLRQPQMDPNLRLLLKQKSTWEYKLDTAVQILALAKIPARIVHGIQLHTPSRHAKFIHWLQVFEKGVWKSHDPETGNYDIPQTYFTWWRGSQPLAELEGGDQLETTVSMALNQKQAIEAAILQSKLASPTFLEFSLFSLPIETQHVYRILLMVPMGAMLLVILRNVVGVKTFGTFMPILIALAFRETQLLWGMVLFSLVVALGLSVRFYLEHLKLLLVPRLAAILIVVILLMAGLSIVSHKLGFERGLSVALFPMVILTMTIERMCIVWEERGPSEAIQQGMGSLVVAAITFLVMTIPFLEHVFFVFPELLLLILAGTLLLGRYSGLRLLELHRFKALAK